jgi:sterol desaturase/sphingolipid hydroxylase (fatty acid hydroxylase superfamily)
MLLLESVVLAAVWWLLWVWERRAPRRAPVAPVWQRWGVNIGLYLAGLLLIWACSAQMLAAAAGLGARLGWGGLAQAPWPDPVKLLLGVLLLDLLQYLLHRLSHAVPLLWRLHQVHHADTELDVSSSVRHHPLEGLAIGALGLLACACLGIPVLSLVLYAGVQRLHAAFCHANIALPPRLDALLRHCIVTPDVHRVHHSVCLVEGNRNFGMVLPWWDRLFGSYRAQPALGHDAMRLGLAEPSVRHKTGWWQSLWLPFGRQGG